MRLTQIARFSFAIIVIISYKKKIVNKNLNLLSKFTALNEKSNRHCKQFVYRLGTAHTTLTQQARGDNDNDCDYLRI